MALRVVAIVQARVGSRRLPGKVLEDLAGQPVAARVLERAAAATRVNEAVLATSTEPQDDPLAALAAGLGIRCHRGSESDVLARVRDATIQSGADAIVRVTADCPLLDPRIVDEVVSALLIEPCDYASNVLRRSFPRGLDAEALWADTVERIHRLATSAEAREHVTWFISRERPDLFVLRSVEQPDDYSDVDWSVDTADDLSRVREQYMRFGLADRILPWRQLVDG